jgi:hypothetical protein
MLRATQSLPTNREQIPRVLIQFDVLFGFRARRARIGESGPNIKRLPSGNRGKWTRISIVIPTR